VGHRLCPKLWIQSVPYSGKQLGNQAPGTRKQTHLYRLKRWGRQKEIISAIINSITSLPYYLHGRTGFHHLSTLPSDLGQAPGPPIKHARELPTMDKHHPHWASGNVNLERLARRDIAVRAHAHLTICTRVWNPSHHRSTSLDQGYTPKCHHDSIRG
jgi:hypothetical protein